MFPPVVIRHSDYKCLKILFVSIGFVIQGLLILSLWQLAADFECNDDLSLADDSYKLKRFDEIVQHKQVLTNKH